MREDTTALDSHPWRGNARLDTVTRYWLYAGLQTSALLAFLFLAVWSRSLVYKTFFAFGAGACISLLTILGHDVEHRSALRTSRWRWLYSVLVLTPGLHPVSLWRRHHNLHHRYVGQIGIDNAFSPMTPQQYSAQPFVRKLYYRFIRSLVGQPFFYLLDFWIPAILLRRHRESRLRSAGERGEYAIVCIYAAVLLALGTVVSLGRPDHAGGLAGAVLNSLIFALILPFLFWTAYISFLAIVQHTGEDVTWRLPLGRPTPRGDQVESTVFIRLPAFLDILTHRIMQHHVHHLNVGIPFPELEEAQADLMAKGASGPSHRWTPAYHWRMTRACQLYDAERNVWLRFRDLPGRGSH